MGNGEGLKPGFAPAINHHAVCVGSSATEAPIERRNPNDASRRCNQSTLAAQGSGAGNAGNRGNANRAEGTCARGLLILS
jgi:hypothetical protein